MATATTTTTTIRPAPLRSSIDLSLDLEHQLAREEGDVPPSPAQPALDPAILAELIVQLRANSRELTGERDALVAELAASHEREAEKQEALQLATERVTALQGELDAVRKKLGEDEEAVSMLRTKLEESRRGLMRLQTESRRMSANVTQFQPGGPLALDLATSATVRAGPKSSRRTSFTPMTGTFGGLKGRHSPSASISTFAQAQSTAQRTTSDPGGDDSDSAKSSLNVPDRGLRRYPSTGRSPPRESLLNPLGAELDALRRELVEARQELTTAKAELQESNDARVASEACVQALRSFIADVTAGMPADGSDATDSIKGISLPPLPTDSNVNEIGDEEKPKAGGWGIKLWRKEASTSSLSTILPTSSASQRRVSDASSTDASRPSVLRAGSSKSGTATSPSSLAPPGKKFGFFWSSPPAPLPPPPPKDDVSTEDGVPGLSPPSNWSSGEEASQPRSPVTQEDEGQELVVHYDDTLTDGESFIGSERGELGKVNEEIEEMTPRLPSTFGVGTAH